MGSSCVNTGMDWHEEKSSKKIIYTLICYESRGDNTQDIDCMEVSFPHYILAIDIKH